MNATLRDNIERLRRRAEQEAANRPMGTRIADGVTRFTGSLWFVAIHLVLYGAWIAINLGWVPGVPPFDPSFVVLAMEASVEAIFLSTFVLITQNRMSAASDRRAALDLHINLLAEAELSRMADLVRRIAKQVGVREEDPRFAEITQNVQPESVLDALDAPDAA